MPEYTLKINGQSKKVNVDADTPLLWVLRDTLELVGTKYGCGIAQCGACTVHIDGNAMRSCSVPVSSVKDEVTTIEGLSPDASHALQDAWREHDVPQCGYCQAGPDEDIDDAMRGNICRCGTYNRIKKAIKTAAK